MSFLLLRVDHFLCLPLARVTHVPHKLAAGSQKLKCLAGTGQDKGQGRTRPIQTLTLEQELEAGSILVRQGDWRQRHSRKKAGDTSKGVGVANSSSGGRSVPRRVGVHVGCWGGQAEDGGTEHPNSQMQDLHQFLLPPSPGSHASPFCMNTSSLPGSQVLNRTHSSSYTEHQASRLVSGCVHLLCRAR